MIMINGTGEYFTPSRDAYSDHVSRQQDQISNYVTKKYGKNCLPRYILINKMSSDRDENIRKFKILFKINDPKLRTFLWNNMGGPPSDTLELVNKKAFSEEEYAFIKKRIEARDRGLTLDLDLKPNNNGIINSERIILRPPSNEDAAIYHKHLKQDGDFGVFTGLKLNKENLERLNPFRSPYTFAVAEKESGKMIGLVGLYQYDEIRRMANIEWYTFKPYRNKGYMREAISALAQAALNQRLFELRETVRFDVYRKHFAKIDIIRADIRVSNEASRNTATACGFKEQYLDRRRAIVNDNSYEDCIIYDLEKSC